MYVRSGTAWTLQAALTGGLNGNGDQFGVSVAISGDTAIVGAYTEDTTAGGGSGGAAYIFARSGTTWARQAKLVEANPASGYFGISVSIEGDNAIIGASGVGGTGGTGSAYVFTRSGTTWSQQAKLVASVVASSNRFGTSVRLNSNTALVGAYGNESAYVFIRSGTVWSQQARLTASDASIDDFFGYSVVLNGDTALVGAFRDNTPGGTDAGSAYVYVRSGTIWTEQTKLQAADAKANDRFGVAVSLSGDTALVGAYWDPVGGKSQAGSAYAFVRNGTTWNQQAKLVSSDITAGDNFGFSMALTADTAVIGAYRHGTPMGSLAGSAYVFLRNGISWSEQLKLTANDGAANDFFGYSVALSGDTVLVGAVNDDTLFPSGDAVVDCGGVYAFRLSGQPTTSPEISVEQPAGIILSDAVGGINYGVTLIGSPGVSKVFTITNVGSANLTGISVTKDGPQAADFILNATGASASLPSGGSTTFTVTFVSGITGASGSLRTAALHIASNDADENPFDIALTGQGFSQTADSDNDGMNDWAEVQLSALGFQWNVANPALVAALYTNANAAGLYTQSQLQALRIDAPLLSRDLATGKFTLAIGLKKSSDLVSYQPFPFTMPETTINGQGKVQFQFSVPDNTAFFRLEAQ